MLELKTRSVFFESLSVMPLNQNENLGSLVSSLPNGSEPLRKRFRQSSKAHPLQNLGFGHLNRATDSEGPLEEFASIE